MNGQIRRFERRDGPGGPGDGCGNVVQFQIQEDRDVLVIGIPRSISGGKNTAMTIPTEGFQSNLEASNMRRNAGGPGGQCWNIGRIEGDRDGRDVRSRLFGALPRITR